MNMLISWKLLHCATSLVGNNNFCFVSTVNLDNYFVLCELEKAAHILAFEITILSLFYEFC